MSRSISMYDNERLGLDICKAKVDHYGFVEVELQVKKVGKQRFLEVYTDGRSTLVEIKED